MAQSNHGAIPPEITYGNFQAVKSHFLTGRDVLSRRTRSGTG